MATIYSLFCPICCKVFCCNISCSEASPDFGFCLTRGHLRFQPGALLSRDHSLLGRLLDRLPVLGVLGIEGRLALHERDPHPKPKRAYGLGFERALRIYRTKK